MSRIIILWSKQGSFLYFHFADEKAVPRVTWLLSMNWNPGLRILMSVQWFGVGAGENRGIEFKWSRGQSQPSDLPRAWEAMLGQGHKAPELPRKCCLSDRIPHQSAGPAGNSRHPGSPYSLPPSPINTWWIPTPDTFSFILSASPHVRNCYLPKEACRPQALCKMNLWSVARKY